MLAFLYNLIISPIELILEIIFVLMFRMFGRDGTDPGLAVIGAMLCSRKPGIYIKSFPIGSII